MAKVLQTAIGNYIAHMESRNHPACMTEKEFQAWRLHEKEIPTLPIREWVCRDCTPSYQARMAAQDLCVNANIDISKIMD